MKKVPLILIICAVALLGVGAIFLFKGGKNESTNEVNPVDEKEKEDKKEEKPKAPPYEKEELYDIISGWAQDLYYNNNYDKCVKTDEKTCFLSLESLEKDYGKDISKFKDERGECLLDTSGITFYLKDETTPFSFSLEGCRFLDATDDPKESSVEE